MCVWCMLRRLDLVYLNASFAHAPLKLTGKTKTAALSASLKWARLCKGCQFHSPLPFVSAFPPKIWDLVETFLPQISHRYQSLLDSPSRAYVKGRDDSLFKISWVSLRLTRIISIPEFKRKLIFWRKSKIGAMFHAKTGNPVIFPPSFLPKLLTGILPWFINCIPKKLSYKQRLLIVGLFILP